jgi:carbamoyltransferase
LKILGISAFYHDSAACLVCDGQIVAAAQEERFTRTKHDASFPVNALRYCLREGRGDFGERPDCVAFYEVPALRFERILANVVDRAPRGFGVSRRVIPLWSKEKLRVEDRIREALDFDGPVLFNEHHLSHASSAFFPSPFSEAAILTLDGVGEWATGTWGIGVGNEIDLQFEMTYPHSLGLLYSAFTYHLGFKVNSGEYKVMGLAPYGEPSYVERILTHLVQLNEDGSFVLNTDAFDYTTGLAMTRSDFGEIFGIPRRQPESPLEAKHMDLACSIQEVTNQIVQRMARHVRRETGMNRLCMAGGVALNCVANGLIVKEGIFDDVWVQPAAGDAGGALGAALLVWHHHHGRPRIVNGRRDSMQGALLGPSYSDLEIGYFLESHRIPHEALTREQVLTESARLLNEGKVIGWFQGRMEFGPRALGCRSILGDARSPAMQSIMNAKIKFRESFRPFAPSVLEEKAAEYFDLRVRSPYMLMVAPVRSSRTRAPSARECGLRGIEKLKVIRSDIPSVTHVDYSARIQTVDRVSNPLYYDLIETFFKMTGCAVIINTSFNVRGEPIVCSPEEAFRCFMRTDMDYLVLGSFLLDKKHQMSGSPRKGELEEIQ